MPTTLVAPVDEKVQHEPHWPWSFTEVTAPFVLQSIEAGAPEAPEEKDERKKFNRNFYSFFTIILMV